MTAVSVYPIKKLRCAEKHSSESDGDFGFGSFSSGVKAERTGAGDDPFIKI